MAITVKTTKPTKTLEYSDEVGLQVIIEMIQEKLRPAAKVLFIIACLQILSGMYGVHHVFMYGEGAFYHRFIYCQAETTQLGPYFEYNIQVILGLILLFGTLLERPYWVVKSWYNLNVLAMSFSWVTLAGAYLLGQASSKLVGVAAFWTTVQLAQIGFAMFYCHWGLQEFMANRFIGMMKLRKEITSTDLDKEENSKSSPQDKV